jgi:hypothetical protein
MIALDQVGKQLHCLDNVVLHAESEPELKEWMDELAQLKNGR